MLVLRIVGIKLIGVIVHPILISMIVRIMLVSIIIQLLLRMGVARNTPPPLPFDISIPPSNCE